MVSTWQGILIGLTVAAPVGPMGLLCIRRSIAFGRSAGLATGLGTASAHAIYGVLALAGVRGLFSTLAEHGAVVRQASAVLIVVIGVAIARSRPPSSHGELRPLSSPAAYGSAMALCLANPLTLVSFASILAGSGFAAGSSVDGPSVVLGVFAGSSLWWLLVSGLAGTLAARVKSNGIRWLNWTSGVFLVVIGSAALLQPA